MLARKYIEFLAVIIACAAAIYIGSHIVTFSMSGLALLTAGILIVVWTFTAGDYWWIPVLTGASIAGVFRVSFKIYPLEIAMALAILALTPLILVQKEKVLQTQRKPLPFIFYLTGIYIIIRMSIDIIPAQGGRGNLSRLLLDASWPFIFAWLFHHFGKTSSARWAIGLAFVALTIRIGAALVGHVTEAPLYIPGINYVLSFSEDESLVPMREVAFMLLLISLILYHSTRSILCKLSLLVVFAFTEALVIMSASRFMTLMALVLPVAFFMWARKWLLILAFGGVAAGGVLFINLYPHSIEKLPEVAERALSGLIYKPGQLEIQLEAAGSDVWHSSLRAEGYRRWTLSPSTFLFGYGIRPSPDIYDTKAFSIDQASVIEISANFASYESAFWTVVAVLGAVGFVLYALLFLHFFRELIPYFLQRPQGTLWEGLLFWGCYSIFIWYVTCNYQGTFPGLELVMIIMASDIIQDGRIEKKAPPPKAAYSVPRQFTLHPEPASIQQHESA
jgi:hypothetical protein